LSKTMQSMGYASNKGNATTTAPSKKEEQLFKLALIDNKMEAVEQKLI
jgi:hypothetical protein